jgi:uncharacterized membrane protein
MEESVESKIKVAGHPLHPMLIVFPLGLLATAVAFDIVGLVSKDSEWFNISFWMIAAGITAGSGGLGRDPARHPRQNHWSVARSR